MPDKVQEPVEVPTEVTAADLLGVSPEAFEAAGAALKSISDGELAPGEAEAEIVTPKPIVPPKPDVKPEGSVAQGWAAVKKAEQEVSQLRSQLKREVSEARKLRESLTGSQKTQADIIAELKKDPRAIEKYGLPLQEFLDRVISDNTTTPQTVARQGDEKYQALEKQIGELKQILQSTQASQGEERFRDNFKKVLATDEFELLRGFDDPEGAALRFAGEYYQANGRLDLTHAQIARHLQDTWQEHLNSLRSSKAVRKALGLPDEPSQEADESEPEPKASPRNAVVPKAKPKTVTPNMASSPARGTPAPRVARQSDEDVLREAARLVPKDVWDQMG